MKTYSVKEISNMLDTSQETVRRWIRSGKLQAVDNKNKKGESKVILESELQTFMQKTPKFIGVLLASAAFPPVGAAALSALGVKGIIKEAKKAETSESEVMVSGDAVYAFLVNKISEERKLLECLLTERETMDRKIQIESESLAGLLEKFEAMQKNTDGQKLDGIDKSNPINGSL